MSKAAEAEAPQQAQARGTERLRTPFPSLPSGTLCGRQPLAEHPSLVTK